MAEVSIRAASGTSDLEEVRRLFEEYSASIGVDLSFQDFASELANLPGDYAVPGGGVWLACAQSQVLGCVALRPFAPPATAELKRLFVRSPGRGRGLGRRLTECALEFARAAGYHRVWLDTLPSMGEAIELYRALGFREIGAYRFNPVPGTVYLELDLKGRQR